MMRPSQWALTGAMLLTVCSTLCAQYSGPSLLSRGGNRPGSRGRAPVEFNFYASARGMYESGLIAPRLNEAGDLEPVRAFGVQAEAGLYGGHDWRRHSIGIDYRGDYRKMPEIPIFNGSNQALAFQSQHRISRRVLLALQQTGGTSNRAFGGFAAPTFGNTGSLGIPINELFDARVYYFQSGGSLSWQKSARTRVFGGGDAFFVKRQSLSLINSQGYRAQSGIMRRMNRRTSLGGTFQYMRFDYKKLFAASSIYTAGAVVEHQFNRSWLLNVTGGLYEIRSIGTDRVQLSPEVSEILGRPTGLVSFSRSDRSPMVEASVSYIQERGRATFQVANGIQPGNGVFLTSTRTSAHAGYSYTGIRRTSLGASVGYTRLGSVVLALPSTAFTQAGGGVTYRLASSLNLMSQMDWRKFGGSGVFGRTGVSLSVGLGFSPGRFPISIW